MWNLFYFCLDVPYKIVIFLIFFGFAYFFAGLVHQFWPHNNEYPGTPIEWHIFWRTSLILLAIASEKLFGLSDALYHYDSKSDTPPPMKGMLAVSVVSIIYVLGMSVYIMIEPADSVPTGAFVTLSLLLLVIVCTVKICKNRTEWCIPGSLLLVGAFLQIMGLFVQLMFKGNTLMCTSKIYSPVHH